MLNTRLTIALRDGILSLPETGQILVLGSTTRHDLSALPKERVTLYCRMFPDFTYWQNKGYDTVSEMPAGGFAAALVCTPRSKSLAQAWIYDASRATNSGLVLLDGQKTDGIDSLLKALRSSADLLGTFSKAHGKLIWFQAATVDGWKAKDTHIDGSFVTSPGVFSADGVDKGSAALVAAMAPEIKGRVADLGAGWGYLSSHILLREGVTSIDLIEADLCALNCARRNISDPRAQFLWEDATQFTPENPYDVVISNPPFHTGRDGDMELGRAFIRSAARMQKLSGRFVMVANRHLPYENTLNELYHTVEELAGSSSFKILSGKKPRRARR